MIWKRFRGEERDEKEYKNVSQAEETRRRKKFASLETLTRFHYRNGWEIKTKCREIFENGNVERSKNDF